MQKKDKYRIYLSPPHQGGEELKYIREALESNWLAPGGMHVRKFESELKKITNVSYCVALNSGTAAIHLALKSLNVGYGDYVICQTFSFVATANPIAYLGAKPVFIDSETETWNMDPELLEEAILDLGKKGIKPKAIVYAHIYGNPARVGELIGISEKYDIPLIEDAAEALGSEINGKSVGSFGRISILSFNGNKIITTSGGGALLTNEKEISLRSIQLSTQARDRQTPFFHTEVGYNYQMSNISGALGLAQIKNIEEWVVKKRKIFEAYKTINSGNNILEWIEEGAGIFSNKWLSVFLVKSSIIRDLIISTLEQNKIEARRLWKPLHLLGIYDGQKSYISGVSDSLFNRGICLPSGVGLNKIDQRLVIEIVKTIE